MYVLQWTMIFVCILFFLVLLNKYAIFFPPFFDEISLQNSLKYFYVISINPLYTFYYLENEI